MEKMKALALLSGGLDSTLAIKLILDQGIDVVALNFTSPFYAFNKEKDESAKIAKKFKIPIKTISIGKEYFKILKNPKHGYGRGMNPCIDCKIFMLKKSKAIAKKIGASFIFTGEVLGQRPMSQYKKALKIIEKEAGLDGKILRPLSAKLMPETEAEKKGWVDRKKLLDISGRSRKTQLQLAEKFHLHNYSSPSGGCLLTCPEFAAKLRDLFKHKKRIEMKDIFLLKVGRHFRYGNNKIIVGRNESENKLLLKLKQKTDYCFEVPNCGSPITLLQGPKTKKAIEKAASLTLHYSDKTGKSQVNFGKEKLNKLLIISALSKKNLEKLKI